MLFLLLGEVLKDEIFVRNEVILDDNDRPQALSSMT